MCYSLAVQWVLSSLVEWLVGVIETLVLCALFFFFLMIRRPPRSTQSRSSAASDVYKRQLLCDPEQAFGNQEGLIFSSFLGLHLVEQLNWLGVCLLYTSPSPRDRTRSRMPSSA